MFVTAWIGQLYAPQSGKTAANAMMLSNMMPAHIYVGLNLESKG